MKPQEEIRISTDGGDEVDIICLEKEDYLLFTNDAFYEITYEEILKKYR